MIARIRIATRQSALALWQAEHVAARLSLAHPGIAIELLPMTTRGDQITDRPLSTVGGKGLFLKELEVAIQQGRAEIAVHSLKDMPMELEPGFAIGAVLERANPFDAWVSNRYDRISELPLGARVGTSSLRRQAQLRALRPDVQLCDLRGNVNTRLSKLDENLYDAIILACAGLERLGLGARIRSRLEAPIWLPAVAQGAIAIEQWADDAAITKLLAPLHDPETALCVSAERAMSRCLQGSCQVSIAGFCLRTETGLAMAGLVGDAVTGELIRAEQQGGVKEAEALGQRVAHLLLERGAARMLSDGIKHI